MRKRLQPHATSPLVAVLAGGAGERLGGAKPEARLGGRPLIAHPIAAARAAGLQVAVVAKPSSPLPELDCEILCEPELPRHPLCGVLTALRHANDRATGADRAVIALACDMPFLTGALLTWLARQPGAVAIEAQGSLQPLPARYVPAGLPLLQAALEQGLSMRAALAGIAPLRVGERELSRFGDPERLCFNVNEPSQLAVAERWLAEEATRPARSGPPRRRPPRAACR